MRPIILMLLIHSCTCSQEALVEPDWVADLRSAVQEDLAADAPPISQPLPAVSIDARYSPDSGTLSGRMRAWIPHTGEDSWQQLGFHLYANHDSAYVDAAITIENVRSAAGKELSWRLVSDERGLLVDLPQAIAAGSATTVMIDFTTQIPRNAGRLGLLSRSQISHSLYSWLPEPAVPSPDGNRERWRFPAIGNLVDPAHTRVADYRLQLQTDPDWHLTSGGIAHQPQPGSWLIVAPRMRNLTLWLSDQPVRVLSLQENEHLVRATFVGRHHTRASICATVASEAIAIAEQAFGPYPRREYDLVFTSFHGPVGGMEASGLTFISREAFHAIDRKDYDPLFQSGQIALHAVIHEVMHSWWYDAVGNDTHGAGWLDESLTEWSTWYVMEQMRDREALQRMVRQSTQALLMLKNHSTPMAATSNAMSEMQYGILLYMRGPLMYEVLRQRVGDEAFLNACRRWYARHSGGTVTRADWESAFLALLPQEERSAFAEAWLDSDQLAPASLKRILPEDAYQHIRQSLASPTDSPSATTADSASGGE